MKRNNIIKYSFEVVYFVALTALTCCTTINIFDPHNTIQTYEDSVLAPYVKRFKEEAAMRGVDLKGGPLSVIFVDNIDSKQYDAVGRCRAALNEKMITIDKSYWTSLKEASKEELIFHELAHCLMGRDHCDNKDADGKRISMLSSFMGDPDDYNARRAELLNELFEPNAGCEAIDVDAPPSPTPTHNSYNLREEESTSLLERLKSRPFNGGLLYY